MKNSKFIFAKTILTLALVLAAQAHRAGAASGLPPGNGPCGVALQMTPLTDEEIVERYLNESDSVLTPLNDEEIVERYFNGADAGFLDLLKKLAAKPEAERTRPAIAATITLDLGRDLEPALGRLLDILIELSGMEFAVGQAVEVDPRAGLATVFVHSRPEGLLSVLDPIKALIPELKWATETSLDVQYHLALPFMPGGSERAKILAIKPINTRNGLGLTWPELKTKPTKLPEAFISSSDSDASDLAWRTPKPARGEDPSLQRKAEAAERLARLVQHHKGTLPYFFFAALEAQVAYAQLAPALNYMLGNEPSFKANPTSFWARALVEADPKFADAVSGSLNENPSSAKQFAVLNDLVENIVHLDRIAARLFSLDQVVGGLSPDSKRDQLKAVLGQAMAIAKVRLAEARGPQGPEN
jgi:hypothetical protein